MGEKEQSISEARASKLKELFKTRDSGIAGLKSTSLFRAVNIELYARPTWQQQMTHFRCLLTYFVQPVIIGDVNKVVMAFGAATFISCISYIVYMNMTDDKKSSTYVTLDEDGGTTTRPKTSKWH